VRVAGRAAHPALENCVSRRTSDWLFPEGIGSLTIESYPLHFGR